MHELMMNPAYEGWAGIWDVEEPFDEEDFEFNDKQTKIPVKIRKPNRKSV